jgi:serine/threonine protein kinase
LEHVIIVIDCQRIINCSDIKNTGRADLRLRLFPKPQRITMTLNIGDRIYHDRYRIDGMLGQGGMGAVYKGWDFNLEIAVAIKENLDLTSEAQKQFNREASMLARLAHPNLPRVTDYFTLPGQGQYLVMDYIEGEDLKSMLDRLGHLPEDQVLSWIGQITDALEFLHNQDPPIIHRDIKPGNIRIRPNGRAALVDFGIAKFYDPKKGTTTGAKAVTPGYSPPEQYGGGLTDRRSDVYSLGATLYHLLTGKEPPESVHRMVRISEMPPPRQINEAISPQIEQAIIKSTEVSTDRRYQTIHELRSALNLNAETPADPQTVPAQSLTATPEAPNSKATIALDSTALESETPEIPPRDKTRVTGTAMFPATAAVSQPEAAWPTSPAVPQQNATPVTGKQTRFPIWILVAGLAVACLGILAIGGLVVSQIAKKSEKTPTSIVEILPSATLPAPSPATDTPEPLLQVSPTLAETPLASPLAEPTEPAAPTSYNTIAGLLVPDGQLIRGVEGKDGYAFVLTRKGALYVYDLSTLSSDQAYTAINAPLAKLQLQNGNGLLRNGDYLYIYGNAGFQVVDIQQPAEPVLKISQKDLMAYNALLTDHYLVLLGEGLIIVYDVQTPVSPQSIAKLITAKGVANFSGAVYQDMLYVSEFVTIGDKFKGLLKVYDFSTPEDFKEIQRIDPGEVAYQLKVVGDSLIRCNSNDLELWDLSQKDYPRYVSSNSVEARVCAVDRGNIIANGAVFNLKDGRLLPIQNFDPNAGQEGSTAQSEAFPYGSAVVGNYVLLVQPGRVLVLAGQ